MVNSASKPKEDPLPEFLPFHGIHYDPAVVGAIADVVAPPYDVIDPSLHARLLARSPHNCVRLDLGDRPGKPGDYREGARLFDLWLAEKALVRDPVPCLYLVEDTFTLAGEDVPHRRWGVIGRVRLEPLESGRIHPHERTHAGPKQDRLRHLRAHRGNLSQVFALFDGDPAGVRALLDGVFSSPPFASFTDAEGTGRRAWIIGEPGLVSDLSDLLSDRDYYIADGHHRYETALAYARERAAADPAAGPDRPYHFVMMALVGMTDPGLAILPTHRLIHGFPAFDMAGLLAGLADAFHVGPLSPGEEGHLREGSVPSFAERGFILYDPASDRLHRLALRRGFSLARAMPDLPAPVRVLETTLAERLLLMRSLGLTSGQIAHQEHLEYVQGARETMAETRRRGQAAIILPPPRLEDLVSVTGAQERMPQKSTFFFPKLLGGIVYHRHED
jgi:uncharacterized protein (DUF1015 family)